MNRPVKVLYTAAALLLLQCPGGGSPAAAQTPTQAPQAAAAARPDAHEGQENAQRGDVYSSEFTDARPRGKKAAAAKHIYRIRRPARPRAPSPAPAAEGRTAEGRIYATVGVTIGRGRPATAAESRDADVAKVQLAGGRELVFERTDEGQPVSHGSLIQMTIEYLAYADAAGRARSNQLGYLYVINRVRFPDGRQGPPALIFPTRRIRGGDNRVVPGQPVTLPSPHRPWQITRSKVGPAQAYETYIIIVSPSPLTDADGFELGAAQPAAESLERLLGKWARLWGGGEMQADLKDGAGRLFTRREQEAGGNPDEARRDTGEIETDLTQDDLPPQTVFRKAVAPGGAMLVTVELPFRESAPPAQ